MLHGCEAPITFKIPISPNELVELRQRPAARPLPPRNIFGVGLRPAYTVIPAQRLHHGDRNCLYCSPRIAKRKLHVGSCGIPCGDVMGPLASMDGSHQRRQGYRVTVSSILSRYQAARFTFAPTSHVSDTGGGDVFPSRVKIAPLKVRSY